MTIYDLTSGPDIEAEDESRDDLERDDAPHSRQQYSPLRIRTTIRFDNRVYTLEEFRTWVRHLRDVETSTDPARAHIVEQMREHIRQQDESASVLAGVLTGQIRDLQEQLRVVTAERNATGERR
jgi:hypothetical protein